MGDNNDYVVFDHVRKVYHVGEVDIEALADATFSVAKGELAIVVGESGAGKTTLLNILGGMDTLTSGKVLLDGREISSLSMKELTKYRRYDIGFVFQFYNLVQNLTALENVSLATQICKDPLDPAETLKAVGLGDRMYYFVDKFVNIVLPRVRDFRGVSDKSFDGRGNYALGVKEQLIFPEINYDDVDKVRGMNIVFVTSAKTDEEAKELLALLGMPFAQGA